MFVVKVNCIKRLPMKQALEVHSKVFLASFVHAAQDFHDVKFEMRYLVRVFAVEYSVQFVNRVQHSRTVYELRKGQPHTRKFAPFARTVMDFRAAEKRSRQKFEGGTQAFALFAFVSLRDQTWSS